MGERLSSTVDNSKRRTGEVHTVTKVELNLEEYPLFCLDRRRQAKKYGVTGSNGQSSLEIRGDKLGLPGPFEQDVFVGLLAFFSEQGMPENGLIHFTRYDLCRLLGISTAGTYYAAIEEAIERLHATHVTAVEEFYKKGTGVEKRREFYIFPQVMTYKERQKRGLVTDRWWVQLPEIVVENFRDGYIKPLDLGLYTSLSTPLARRVYRYLDRKRHRLPKWQTGAAQLAAALPLARAYPSYLKAKLEQPHNDLVKHGYLVNVKYEGSGRDSVVTYRFGALCIPGVDLTSEQQMLVEDVIGLLRDSNSRPFYEDIVRKLPAELVRRCMSEAKVAIHAGEARKPAALFTAILRSRCQELGLAFPWGRGAEDSAGSGATETRIRT